MTVSERSTVVVPLALERFPVALTDERIGSGGRNATGRVGAAHSADQANLGRIHPEVALRLINRIFAAGLQLAALQALLDDGALSERAAAVIEELDTVIRDVRAGVLE